MKKYLIIAAVALVASAACTKVETVEAPARKITFHAGTYAAQTKADTVSVLSEFTSFKAKAFLHADGYEGTTQDFFGTDGETISPDNTSNPTYWAPSHDYYWPKSSQSYINFIAWYDKRNVAPTTSSETALSWSNYVVAPTDTLLYADEAWHFKDNDHDKYDKNSVTEGVPMLFHHALAKLTIKALADPIADGNTTWTVILDTVKLAGVKNTGTLSLENADPGTANTPRAWTNSAGGNVWSSPSNPTTITMLERLTTTGNETSPAALTTTATTMLDGQSVLPQVVTDDMKLTIVYSIYYKYNGTPYAKERIATETLLSAFSDAVSEWGMNKKITYTITINPQTTKVKIDPAMVDWETADAGTADLTN